jgi:hypothetical protein
MVDLAWHLHVKKKISYSEMLVLFVGNVFSVYELLVCMEMRKQGRHFSMKEEIRPSFKKNIKQMNCGK